LRTADGVLWLVALPASGAPMDVVPCRRDHPLGSVSCTLLSLSRRAPGGRAAWLAGHGLRLMGLTPLMPWLTCLITVRNQRILNTWDQREQDNARRAAASQPPRTRKRRRHLADTTTPP
jgi:hypothetical protein